MAWIAIKIHELYEMAFILLIILKIFQKCVLLFIPFINLKYNQIVDIAKSKNSY
jgi:hypothetical protein